MGEIKREGGAKGSITVEAALTFPFFLFFLFLFVFIIKYTCVSITLNHAVNEAAKLLAAASYPISFLNELEDSIICEGDESASEAAGELKKSNQAGTAEKLREIFDDALTGMFDENSDGNGFFELIEALGSSVASSKADELKELIRENAVKGVAESYFALKEAAEKKLAEKLVGQLYDKSLADFGQVEIIAAFLPAGIAEYDYRRESSTYKAVADTLLYTPSQDDVVIIAQYNVSVPVPFFRVSGLTARHVAVEKAWLTGSRGVYAQDTGGENGEAGDEDGSQGDEFEEKDKSSTVYVTRTGIRYHKSGCRYLARSRIPIKTGRAETEGYTPCKVCFR